MLVSSSLILLLVASASLGEPAAGGPGSRLGPLAPPRESPGEPVAGAAAAAAAPNTSSSARPRQESASARRYGPSAGNYQLAAGDIEAASSNINEIMAPSLASSASRRQALLAAAPVGGRGQPQPGEAADESEERDEPEPEEAAESRRAGGAARTRQGPSEARRHQEEEAQSRREQEAAEASEAELADRSALDEQRQAQREIILAQAQSEAKAIREQQESLLKQQLLQQQMISRRHNELEANRTTARAGPRRGRPAPATKGAGGHHQQRFAAYRPVLAAASQLEERRPSARSRHSPLVDSQFSDQPDSTQQQQQQQQQQPEPEAEAEAEAEELGLVQAPSTRRELYEHSARRSPAADLQPAAQHLYGAQYDTLGAHHQANRNYFQFAESYKGGQFHSGYKRGGKRLQISGHSSQHSDHAEGHTKWQARRGAGSSHWDYQHGSSPRRPKHHYYAY